MIEKVNKFHPDKVADRIAGAIVDAAYNRENKGNWRRIPPTSLKHPRIAVEVLTGHGFCFVIAETSVKFLKKEIRSIVDRIVTTHVSTIYIERPQDPILASNQKEEIRCGDNGIFRGVPLTEEQRTISHLASDLEQKYKSDGKYILTDEELVICQSNAPTDVLKLIAPKLRKKVTINPLGNWKGGINVDSGATNRKLGSDMGDAVTGGGLHGKDFSKADVSVNIYCHLKAQKVNDEVKAYCAIGDEFVKTNHGNVPFEYIVRTATEYVGKLGGFERFAEQGLF